MPRVKSRALPSRGHEQATNALELQMNSPKVGGISVALSSPVMLERRSVHDNHAESSGARFAELRS